MADQIKHGSTEVVGSTGKVSDTGLIDKLGSTTTITGGQTVVPSITADVKGRVTSLTGATVKMTGIDFCASGNTLVDQTVFVETTAPDSSDGENGDVWYQTIS